MTSPTDLAALAQRLREREQRVLVGADDRVLLRAAADAIEALAQERDNWRGVATVAMEDRDRLTGERDEACEGESERAQERDEARRAFAACADDRRKLIAESARLAQENERLVKERDQVLRYGQNLAKGVAELTKENVQVTIERDSARAALRQVEWISQGFAYLDPGARGANGQTLTACIPPAHEPQRSEYMAATPKAKEGANDAD